MIKYNLQCDNGHQFDSWFANSDAFETLAKSGHLSCAVCGATTVTRSLSTPSVSVSKGKADPTPAQVEQALTKIREDVEKNSTDVGSNFATEARSMHLGDTPEKAIHGVANADEAKSLIEDGVPVVPLPFIPKRNTN
ncbi:MAG: DUF1178 family protein [Planktomarina sp.]